MKTIQAIMNKAYNRFKGTGWTLAQFWGQLSEQEKLAVFIGNLNYQVENGGFWQWHDNGFSACAGELVAILRGIGPAGEKTAEIVTMALDAIENAPKGGYEDVPYEDDLTGEVYYETEWVDGAGVDLEEWDDAYLFIRDLMLAEAEAALKCV